MNGRDLTNADRPLNRNKAYFQPFLLENTRVETTKVYVNVSDSTQLNKNLTFVQSKPMFSIAYDLRQQGTLHLHLT